MNSEPLPANSGDLTTQPGGVKKSDSIGEVKIRVEYIGLVKQLLFGFAAFINGFFSDDSGNVSSMRALMLFAGVVILGTWAWICIANRSLVDLPLDIAALLGGLTGLKLTQRKIAETISTGNDKTVPSTQQTEN